MAVWYELALVHFTYSLCGALTIRKGKVRYGLHNSCQETCDRAD